MDEQSIFLQALDQPAGKLRAAWLDDVCGLASPLRERIGALLRRHEQANSFLERPAAELAETIMPDASGDNLTALLEAGLAPAFGKEKAVVIGSVGHSVLKILRHTIDTPHVVLREPTVEGADPIQRPNSPEIPQPASDTRYQLQGEIARGGMGAIIKGRDTDLGRDLAIKVLLDQHKDKPEVIQRFIEEAQISGQLQHPGIAPVYELGQFADHRPFFSMKLIRGETLAKLLAARENAAADRGRFLGIFEHVCQTMAYAHSRGVIHRDLKPANIMVGSFGEVQVMDWGLAKVLPAGGIADEKQAHDQHQGQSVIQTQRSKVGSDAPGTFGTVGSETQAGSVMGTPAYMPPEQALGDIDNMDERADVFGLGAILCEILTGKPPYVADDGAQVYRMASRGKLEDCFARLEACGADDDLVALTKHCLEFKPADRPRDAGVLAAGVSGYLESVETKLRTTEMAKVATQARAEESVRRHNLIHFAGTAVTILLVIGIAASVWQTVRADREATRAEAESQLAREAERAASELATAEAAARSLAQQETRRAEAAIERAKEQLTRSEWLVYASKIMLAQTDFEAGNGGLAAHYLDECQPNLRGWEHRYLSTRVNARQTLTGHTASVHSVAFSPDSQRIVTGSSDRTAKVWDSETGQELLALKGHTDAVTCASFSPDGQRIVTGSWDRTAKVWDSETGQELLALKGHTDGVHGVAFGPDGKRIVTGSWDQTAKVWDAEMGQELLALKGHTLAVTCVAFRPDGKQIVTSSMDGTAKMWDAEKGHVFITLEGHPGAFVYRVVFSPDGQRIVTISNDRTAKVWDAEKGHVLISLKGHTNAVTSVAYSPDGQRIVTGSRDQTIKVWDSQTGEEVLTLKGHAGHVFGVALSPDGRRIVTCSDDKTAKVWDAEKGQEIPTLKGHADGMTSMAFSADSQRVVIGSRDNTARVWNTVTGQEVLRLEMHSKAPAMGNAAAVLGVAISPDGQRIATGSQDKTARVWDATTGEELLVLNHPNVVTGVAFSPDGKRLVTGSWDQTAKVWDAATGQEFFTLQGHAGYVMSVAFSPDGKRIVTGSWDRTAKVWDTATGQEFFTLQGHAEYVMSVAFSSDGNRIVTGSSDNTAKVWDTATGQELLTLKGHTGGTVRSVAFSPDGERIVTGSDDWTARLWDTATGQEVLALKGHTEAVYCVAFSPDGNRIVTGIAGARATAKVWDATTARELLILTGHTDIVTRVAFSDDGQRIFAWDQQKKLLAWSVASGEPVDPVDPPPEPLPGPARSPDGFHHAVPQGNTVVVTDTSPLPDNAWPRRTRGAWAAPAGSRLVPCPI